MTLGPLQHVNVRVRDLERAGAFYDRVLGLERAPRPAMRNDGIWYRLGAQQLHLSVGEANAGEGHFAIEVDDLDGVAAALAQRGCPVEIAEHVPGAGRQGFVRDPDGNRIELNEPDALGSRRERYLETAEGAVTLVAHPQVGARWDADSVLPGMTVGALAAHLLRSVFVVEENLDQEPPGGDAELVDAAGYYAALPGIRDRDSAVNKGVVERSVEGARRGHAAAVDAARAALGRLRGRLAREPRSRRVAPLGIPMLLDEYLGTRLVELSVHVDDLALSVGVDARAGDAALRDAIAILTGTAVARSGPLAVLRALTRSERDADAALRVL